MSYDSGSNYRYPKQDKNNPLTPMEKEINNYFRAAGLSKGERDLLLKSSKKVTELTVLEKIEYWTNIYELSFQFWGTDNNNVFINKDDVEIASFGGESSINDILELTINWCEKSNPRLKYAK